MNQRYPNDVRLLAWRDQAEFRRVRAEWLQLQRWDNALASSTIVVVAEIAGRMSSDKDFAFPSVRRLAADLGQSEPTVKRAVAQATRRGWLFREKRGFSKSNNYAMAISVEIGAAVIAAHQMRVDALAEYRSAPLRSRLISIDELISRISSKPTHGSTAVSPRAQNRSLNKVNSDLLTLSINPTTNVDHISCAEGLAAEPPPEVNFHYGLVDEFQVSHDLYRALGSGNVAVGKSLAEHLGPARVEWLSGQIREKGVAAASYELESAAAAARLIEAGREHKRPIPLADPGSQTAERPSSAGGPIEQQNAILKICATDLF